MTPHGLEVAGGGPAAPERQVVEDQRGALADASRNTSNAGSSAVSRGCAMSSALGSMSTPAAVSLRTASVVAPASGGCSQTRVARPTTAASSGVRSISGRRELVGADPVAGLVVEVGVDVPDLDRDAEAAQLVLVALEHLLEGVGGRLGVDDLPDPVLGDVVPLDQEHDEQVQQPLGSSPCSCGDPVRPGRLGGSASWVRRRRGRRPRSRACRARDARALVPCLP